MEKPKLVYVTYIKTTPEELWEALTNPDFIQQYWYGRRNESDLRVGSKIQSYGPEREPEWSGEILKCEPPRVLSYTFAEGSEAPSRVTFEIGKLGESPGPDGEPVRLTITHDEFPVGSEVMEKVSNGWPGIMAGLKTLLETGHPLGITWN
jgi:uncharacterized protein YndB with AHSA1/START domain